MTLRSRYHVIESLTNGRWVPFDGNASRRQAWRQMAEWRQQYPREKFRTVPYATLSGGEGEG